MRLVLRLAQIGGDSVYERGDALWISKGDDILAIPSAAFFPFGGLTKS